MPSATARRLGSVVRHRTAIALSVLAALVLWYLPTADDLNGLLGSGS